MYQSSAGTTRVPAFYIFSIQKVRSVILFTIIWLAAVPASAQVRIITDSVIQTGTCAGSSIIVRYKLEGGTVLAGNKFTAELSNAFGQFTSPIAIGSSNFNVGLILARLPQNISFGFLYRIRVVASNPAVIGSPSPNTIIVTSTALTATIVSQQGTSLCRGDSVTLQAALPNATYKWSTGATTQSIKVGNPGTYSVKVTDPLGCDAADTVQVTWKQGCALDPGRGMMVHPNPAAIFSTVTISNIPSGFTMLHVIDYAGRTVVKVPLTQNQVQLKGAYFSIGIYQLVISNNETVKYGGRLSVIH